MLTQVRERGTPTFGMFPCRDDLVLKRDGTTELIPYLVLHSDQTEHVDGSKSNRFFSQRPEEFCQASP